MTWPRNRAIRIVVDQDQLGPPQRSRRRGRSQGQIDDGDEFFGTNLNGAERGGTPVIAAYSIGHLPGADDTVWGHLHCWTVVLHITYQAELVSWRTDRACAPPFRG